MICHHRVVNLLGINTPKRRKTTLNIRFRIRKKERELLLTISYPVPIQLLSKETTDSNLSLKKSKDSSDNISLCIFLDK